MMTQPFDSVSSGEISCYKDEIETELEKSRPKLRGIYAAYAKEIGLILSQSISTSPQTRELNNSLILGLQTPRTQRFCPCPLNQRSRWLKKTSSKPLPNS